MAKPRLSIAYPQLFVADVTRAAAFYVDRLGFTVVYLYGEPPFYGLVERDGVGLNLRCVERPAIDPTLREDETLLSANIPVDDVEALFAEFTARGVDVAQPLKAQPCGESDFIIRYPDGYLLCFASATVLYQRRCIESRAKIIA